MDAFSEQFTLEYKSLYNYCLRLGNDEDAFGVLTEGFENVNEKVYILSFPLALAYYKKGKVNKALEMLEQIVDELDSQEKLDEYALEGV